MITINKKYKVTGTGPFTYTIIPSDPNVTVTPSNGVTDSIIEFKCSILDTFTADSFSVIITAKAATGCTEKGNYVIYSPCINFGLSQNESLVYSAPNKYSFPANTLDIVKYEWTTGPNLNIVSGQGTPSIFVEEKANSSSNTHTVACTVYNNAGCKYTISGFHTTCSAQIPVLNVDTQCGIKDETFNSIKFIGYNYKVGIVTGKALIGNYACQGCEFDYSTFTLSAPSNTYHIHDNFGNFVILDKNLSGTTVYNYTIKDTCGKIYNSSFILNGTTCNAQVGCFQLPKLQAVNIACTDINLSAVDQPSIGCASVIANPYYSFKTAVITNPLDISKVNWTTFKFLAPTNQGTPIAGYVVSSDGKCMKTPYGVIKLNNNHEIEYTVLVLPGANTITSEPFEYRVETNADPSNNLGACISDVGSSIFIHTCVSDPITTDFTECISCNKINDIDLTSKITMNGLQLTAIEIDSSTINTTSITISTDVANKKIKVSTTIVNGTYTFKYRIQGTRQSTTATTKYSEWKTVTLDIRCAGNAVANIIC